MVGLTSRSTLYAGFYAGGGVAFVQAVQRAAFRYRGGHQSAASAGVRRTAGGTLEETPMTIDWNAEPPLPSLSSPLPAPACGSLWNDYLHRLLGTAQGCVAGAAAANDDESDPEPACCCAAG